jgi:hypothetical protein
MTQPAQHDAERPACIGVDVGGTFTDVVLSDGSQVWRAKSPSTPGSLAEGVIAACRLVAQRSGTTLEQLLPRVNWFGLGTTAVTNTIASRVGLRVGLITSAGFEDLVPIARGIRVASNGWLVPPVALIDRECIVGVPEHRDRTGQVVVELDVAAVAAAATPEFRPMMRTVSRRVNPRHRSARNELAANTQPQPVANTQSQRHVAFWSGEPAACTTLVVDSGHGQS